MTTGRRICVGVFAGAHGVKGDMKVKTFTAAERGVADYGPVESEDGGRRFHLKFLRVLKPGLALVSAPEVSSREAAAALAGVRLFIDRSMLPEAAEDEYYIEDLVGLLVEDDQGSTIGHVRAVHDFGAGPVIEIRRLAGKEGSLLAPFTRQAVPMVDIASGRLTIEAAALEEIIAPAAGSGEAP